MPRLRFVLTGAAILAALVTADAGSDTRGGTDYGRRGQTAAAKGGGANSGRGITRGPKSWCRTKSPLHIFRRSDYRSSFRRSADPALISSALKVTYLKSPVVDLTSRD